MIQYGAVLFLLCYHLLPGAPTENLKVCWEHILSSYKDLNIVERYRYRGIRKLTLFKRKVGPPKLKGRASQVAALGEPMLRLWTAFMNESLEAHK